MAISGAQIKSVLAKVGATSGQVTTWDSLASGARAALKRLEAANGKRLTVVQAAAFLATMAQESGYFRTTTEYGSGQRYAPYIGRTFEQITWQQNYGDFGAWAKRQGLVTDANVFVKSPTSLSSLTWAWLGGVWYWTASRSAWDPYANLLEVSATGSILLVSRAVNVGNPNSDVTPYGMAERTAMFDGFKALGASILPSTATTTSAPTTTNVPAGAIPGTAAQVIAEANRLWNKYKGKLYCYNWPGLKELGRTAEYWCADFVRLALRRATGYDWANYTAGKSGPAYCPALVSGMVRDPYWSEVKYGQARGGDVVFFFRGSLAYHVGLVETGPSGGGHDMRTIEGNTSTPGISSSMSAGGTLTKKTRDDRYYSMRIFRPTYVPPAVETTDPVEDADADATTEQDAAALDEMPDISSFDAPSVPPLRRNPVDGLNPSSGFWKAVTSPHAKRVSRASLWYGGAPVDGADDLPLVANSSNIRVGGDNSAVRRRADLTFAPSPYGRHRNLRELLEYPGVEIRVETGFDLGGYAEMVPVFQSSPTFTVETDSDGQIKVDAPDRMEMIAADGFPRPVWSNTQCSMVGAVQWFIEESDPGARLVDLTGRTDLLPDLFWDAGATSRVDAVTQLASALGAEIFKSPAAGIYVLRPMSAPGALRPRWTVQTGVDIVQSTRRIDKSRIYNKCIVTSRRSDTPVARAEWVDTDPQSVTRFGGVVGRRELFVETSLISEREDLEAYARSVVARWSGAVVEIDWSMLVNPLMEVGDTIRVVTPQYTYECAIDSFEIPLGSQPAVSAKARSLSLPGVG